MPHEMPESARSSLGVNALEAVVGSIPIAGAVTVAVLKTLHENKQREVDEDFWAMLNARINALEASEQVRFDPNDDQFFASVVRVLRASRETADSDKRRLLAESLAWAGRWSRFEYSERERFLSLIIALQPGHVRLLRFLQDPRAWLLANDVDEAELEKELLVGGNIGSVLRKYLAQNDNRQMNSINRFLTDLKRENLAVVNTTANMSSGGVLQPRTTDLGNDLLSFIGDAKILGPSGASDEGASYG